ncbi:MAG: ChbG/HpnK family deacetylase [Saprospiraceae bacterium]|nr:ChbG/HpnK family deacetylase [Saprospiraceae bacterium]
MKRFYIKLLLCCMACVQSNVDTCAQSTEDKEIKLIIRVDDMGCSHATNTGIMKTFDRGIATSVEIMAPTPWYPEAIKMLQEHPDIDVGLHLTLTSEWSNIKWRPLTPVPSLTDERGYFYPMIWENRRLPDGALTEHNWDINEIEKEIRAQIEMVKKDLPWLSHLSAHMGCMNIDEKTSALFKQLAKEYNLDIIPEEMGVQRFPSLGNNTLPTEQRVSAFIDALNALTPGTWLYVEHPADDYPEQQAIGHPGYEHVAQDRYAVMNLLVDQRVKAVIKDRGIKLVSYADLVKN